MWTTKAGSALGVLPGFIPHRKVIKWSELRRLYGTTMSSENDKARDKTFQVVDKRRFDSAGHERSTEAASTGQGQASGILPGDEQPASAAQVEENSGNFTMKDSPQVNEAESVAFTSFIMSLATQVLVQIGEMPPPEGMNIPIDFESARQTIDIMAMLQRRTKGNLSAEEGRFMEEVLHSLRVSFISAKKKAG